MKSSFVLSLALGLVLASCSQKSEREQYIEEYNEIKAQVLDTTGPGHPALWKMSDEDTTIYLFGTVHLLPPELEWQNDLITQAFNASEKVFFEVDLESPEAMQTFMRLNKERGFLPEGQNLFDKMSVEDATNVKAALETIEFNPGALETLQPWNATMNVMQHFMIKEGYNPMSGVEMVFTRQAKDQGKSFGYLETIEAQMNAITGGTFDEQLEDLVDGMSYLDLAPEVLDLMLDEWADGDVEGLGLLAATPDSLGESRDSYDRILVNRNKNWIPNIEAILETPGTNFIAVGAGHLAGPDSVVLMLEAKGYDVDRIQ